MRLKEINGFTLVGYSVRTSNHNEMKPSSAKIGNLWTKFYSLQGLHLTEKSNVYGVYTDYESDVNGQYTVFAASDSLDDQSLTALTVTPGSYLVFSAQGELPSAVIALWQDVWQYFASDSCKHQRAYTSDYEHYTSANSVDIYIAVK